MCNAKHAPPKMPKLSYAVNMLWIEEKKIDSCLPQICQTNAEKKLRNMQTKAKVMNVTLSQNVQGKEH